MEPEGLNPPVPTELVADCTVTSLLIAYSAPMPGIGSRYADISVAHETRLLTVVPVRDAAASAGMQGVGETVLDAVLGSRRLTGFADVRAAGYIAPLARAALLGEPFRRVLTGLGNADIRPFISAFEAAGDSGPFSGALHLAQQAGKEATLRDVARFVAARDPLAREYAAGYEITTRTRRTCHTRSPLPRRVLPGGPRPLFPRSACRDAGPRHRAKGRRTRG